MIRVDNIKRNRATWYAGIISVVVDFQSDRDLSDRDTYLKLGGGNHKVALTEAQNLSINPDIFFSGHIDLKGKVYPSRFLP